MSKTKAESRKQRTEMLKAEMLKICRGERGKGSRGEMWNGLRIMRITIVRLSGDTLWLVNAAGEGMATSEKKFGRWVAEYFKREF